MHIFFFFVTLVVLYRYRSLLFIVRTFPVGSRFQLNPTQLNSTLSSPLTAAQDCKGETRQSPARDATRGLNSLNSTHSLCTHSLDILSLILWCISCISPYFILTGLSFHRSSSFHRRPSLVCEPFVNSTQLTSNQLNSKLNSFLTASTH
jgi:hypothetical protein